MEIIDLTYVTGHLNNARSYLRGCQGALRRYAPEHEAEAHLLNALIADLDDLIFRVIDQK